MTVVLHCITATIEIRNTSKDNSHLFRHLALEIWFNFDVCSIFEFN